MRYVWIYAALGFLIYGLQSPSEEQIERSLDATAARYAHELCLEGGTENIETKELAAMLEEMTGEKECSEITFRERWDALEDERTQD